MTLVWEESKTLTFFRISMIFKDIGILKDFKRNFYPSHASVVVPWVVPWKKENLSETGFDCDDFRMVVKTCEDWWSLRRGLTLGRGGGRRRRPGWPRGWGTRWTGGKYGDDGEDGEGGEDGDDGGDSGDDKDWEIQWFLSLKSWCG